MNNFDSLYPTECVILYNCYQYFASNDKKWIFSIEFVTAVSVQLLTQFFCFLSRKKNVALLI